ncbi:MAG: ABC transporter ATP-binding protein [Flavisolibacter sp.]
MTIHNIIEVEGLSKRFTEVKAVDELDFSVTKGEVYGFLGQNGAGKSTTIRMLLTLVKPTSGTIRIFGKNIYSHRREILLQTGAIIEKPDLYKYLTALENLQIMSRLSGFYPDKNILMHQLEKLGIADRAHSKGKTFSQGMKQRLGIACALIHDPQLIILDEPTNGLDPQGIADVRNLILQLSREEGKTVFVSSHLLGEMELIADSMLIIDQGKKIAEGKVSSLLHPSETLVTIETNDNDRALALIGRSRWANRISSRENLELKMDSKEIPALVELLVQEKLEIHAVQPRHSLEDYFLSLTKGRTHVAAYKD